MRTPAAAEPSPRRLPSLLEAYLAERQARRYSESSQDHVRTVLPRFFTHLRRHGVRDIRGAREEHLLSFGRELAQAPTMYGRPYSRSTVTMYLGNLRAFFSWLDHRNLILRNPAEHVTFPRQRRLPRSVLGVAEARRLMLAPCPWTVTGQRDRALLEVLYGTAVRAGECLRIHLSDVDLARGALLVRNGKGRKDRVVPLRGRAAAALRTYLKESRPELLHDPSEEALFLSRTGRPLEHVTLHGIVRDHAWQAGIRRRVSPHVLRHACATHLLRGGADVRHIQELLGHARLNTTMIYTRVDVSDLEKVIERAHPRERRWGATIRAPR